MKKSLPLLLFVVACISLNQAYSQCIADAGKDTLICFDFNEYVPIQLGGNPTASGGSGNYQYSWSATYSGISAVFTASDFLDDTTASNPNLINIANDSITFKLTVIDDLGNSCMDSVKVTFSQWTCVLGECIFQISQGDTVELWAGCITNFPPFAYSWSPDYSISDITAANPSVWPDSSIQYDLIMTDSRGCSLYPLDCSVIVEPSAVYDANSKENFSGLFPDPINENSVIRFENLQSRQITVEIFTFTGNKILEASTTDDTFEIGKSIRVSGEYFYRISFEGKTISKGRFTRN